ncbi:MAG: hypothetical protein Q9221_002305 [Calogaya cf. arnoldii]
MAIHNSVGLLGLPYTIRGEILSYLLPDQHSILHDAYRVDRSLDGESIDFEPPIPQSHWSTFDYKSKSPYPDILLANRQLYADGFHYLYELKTFKVVLSLEGRPQLGQRNMLGDLPPLPYRAIKEFVIEVHAQDLNHEADSVRSRLLGLFLWFRKKKIHFRKLRIKFPEPWESLEDWYAAWDGDEPDTRQENCRIDWDDEHTFDEFYKVYGHKSIFTWVLSTCLVCPGLADECVITPPPSLEERPYIWDYCEWYAERIDGRCPIDPEDEPSLQKDLCNFMQARSSEKRWRNCDCHACEKEARVRWRCALSGRLPKACQDLKKSWENVMASSRCIGGFWGRNGECSDKDSVQWENGQDWYNIEKMACRCGSGIP